MRVPIAATKVVKPEFKWRSAHQIRGNMAQLLYAIDHIPVNGQVRLDGKTAKNLVEICRQAIHTELGHGPSAYEEEQARRDLR